MDRISINKIKSNFFNNKKSLDMEVVRRWNHRNGFFGPVLMDSKKGEAYKQPIFYTIGKFI